VTSSDQVFTGNVALAATISGIFAISVIGVKSLAGSKVVELL
jgi:hypothetical protein